ncbi:MAG TPA: pyridoxamine 5'-phosphate oxidase family protein [Gaiella sp.]
MAKVFDTLEPRLVEWIGRQRVFFVGTAPVDGGNVNVSPKGPIETLRVLGPATVAYLDFVGSGIETVAHLKDDGRIVIMLCAFEGPPRIVRLHGRGRVVEPGDPELEPLLDLFSLEPDTVESAMARSVIVIDVERISDSCGFGVPLMEYAGRRTQQLDWGERKLRESPDALRVYEGAHNALSIDGLPGLRAAHEGVREVGDAAP